ncbi:SET domain-containing protein [Daldinia vernicosa]|uniref:SET domain-containing protein n=1 Tax=Daldinia vernicosa TaxID=114800 RepID=UPI0020083D80|nr:SET domain-containing protein [Daldinia vernicosa]KAI0851990.1 SET domain-containing protein [Daldinia vernicosa]
MAENLQADGYPDPFVVRDSGFKGMGCFASRDIKAGERVLVERCALWEVDHSDVYDRTNSLLESYLQLSETDKAKIRDLHSETNPVVRFRNQAAFEHSGHLITAAQLDECVTVRLVHAANCFEIESSKTAPDGTRTPSRTGVFIKASRFNHSCDPNCWYTTTSWTGHFICTPMRPIKEGEEITISYIPNQATREKRQAQLLRCWGFICQCNRCEGWDTDYDVHLEEAYKALNPNADEERILPRFIQGGREAEEHRILRRLELLQALLWPPELYFGYLDAAEFFVQLKNENKRTDLEQSIVYSERAEGYLDNAVRVGEEIWEPGEIIWQDCMDYAEKVKAGTIEMKATLDAFNASQS